MLLLSSREGQRPSASVLDEEGNLTRSWRSGGSEGLSMLAWGWFFKPWLPVINTLYIHLVHTQRYARPHCIPCSPILLMFHYSKETITKPHGIDLTVACHTVRNAGMGALRAPQGHRLGGSG